MMPRLDGVSTVTAIRADPRTAKIAIIMVSTQGYPADIQRGMEAGVDAYITKPFDPDFMVDTVSEVIERLRIEHLERVLSGTPPRRTVVVHGEEVVPGMNNSWTCEVAVR